jgi:hypothetical protein
MLYNWRQRRIAAGPIDVFKPHRAGSALNPSYNFGWPIYIDGRLTLFSSTCTTQYLTCGSGHVWTASTATLSTASSYEPKEVTTDGTAAWQPMSISVGRYSGGLRLIETTSIGGAYNIFSATKVTGPWHLDQSGTLPDCHATSVGYCHGVEGHPELSTNAAIFISYKDPNSGPGGHMVISAIPDA